MEMRPLRLTGQGNEHEYSELSILLFYSFLVLLIESVKAWQML